MNTAKLFRNGRSQAVRLPKEFRLTGSDVYIKKLDRMILLLPKKDPWSLLAKSLDRFSEDFLSERKQPSPQRRAGLA